MIGDIFKSKNSYYSSVIIVIIIVIIVIGFYEFIENFDETFYLDDTTPQKGVVQKGEVLQGLRNLDRQNQNSRLNASGRSDSTAELTQMLNKSTTKTVGNATKMKK